MACMDRELLRLVPRVLRARDFHLYLEGGKRLTDLWRSGGKAVLGHKRPRVLVELKNAAERGLFCALPHPMEKRFIKALGEFFPERQFRLYLNEGSMYQALDKAGISDPVPLWRPFIREQGYCLNKEPDSGLSSDKMKIFIPVLPWPMGPEVLVLDKSMEDSFPSGELIPPVLLAPAARALYDLAGFMKTKTLPRYPKISKALSQDKSNGSDAVVWRRQGIYLTTETKGEEYAALFRKFLEGGFLIPPSPAEPVILPLSMSGGEESKLAQLIVS